MLLALAGKVSAELQEIIRKRPKLFAQLIRELKTCPITPCCASCAKSVTATGEQENT